MPLKVETIAAETRTDFGTTKTYSLLGASNAGARMGWLGAEKSASSNRDPIIVSVSLNGGMIKLAGADAT